MKWLECKIPPVIVFLLCAAAMEGIHVLTPDAGIDRRWRIAIASISLLAGGILGVAGLAHFRKARTTIHPNHPDRTSALVRGGVYRITRNPMYLALVFGLLAWTCALDNAYSFLGIALFVGYMNRFQIRPEECALEVRFGEAFAAYCHRVRRWL